MDAIIKNKNRENTLTIHSVQNVELDYPMLTPKTYTVDEVFDEVWNMFERRYGYNPNKQWNNIE